MCGIAGVLGSNNIGDLYSVVTSITDKLKHRGPDAKGIWVDKKNSLALGHRRLSFLDLSESGNQPMVSASGRYMITLNGEIYNFKGLKAQFRDYPFRGTSDTEVLLASFDRLGIDATLNLLTGMYAFAVWDKECSELTLVRDRFGEKPLYYGSIDRNFVFASELKAFRGFPQFRTEISQAALQKYFLYGNVPAPQSIFENIWKVPPGTSLKVKLGTNGIKIGSAVSYWSAKAVVENSMPDESMTLTDAKSTLRKILKDVVANQLIADVPVGAFLSGGIDSSLVVALASRVLGNNLSTFTVGFEEGDYNEAGSARLVAEYFKTKHHEMVLSAKDLLHLVPRISEIYDEPFSDSSQIPTHLISKFAVKSVKACLSGDGGDEVFLGYNRYFVGAPVWKKLEKIPLSFRQWIGFVMQMSSPASWDRWTSKLGIPTIGEKLEKLTRSISAVDAEEFYNQLVCHWLDESPVAVEDSLRGALEKSKFSSNLNLESAFMLADIHNYLPNDILTKVDRASMAVSLETRAPFLDHNVFAFSQTLPLKFKSHDGVGKIILRELLKDLLPEEIVSRPKRGFAVPLDLWLRGPLKGWVCEVLSEKSLMESGLLNPTVIRKKLDQHLSGTRNWQYFLWDVIVFQTWFQRWVKGLT
ncbi:MAG: hypothetical protein A4S09_00340 [Proteobacteria bacterium SG_bin7]|nr:MAG: hypothetical protein A4S09_00340 [Proteobacteria bacterium SG_bin7]